MEQNQDSSLFGLNIDPATKNHLGEAARWAKFLAIVGFVMCGLIVVLGIFFSSFLSGMSGYNRYDTDVDLSSTVATTVAILYILIAVLYFFPCLFLYRFATKMRSALVANDQETLNSSFQNLKAMFRYVGILTIIVLCLYAIGLLIRLGSAGSSGF